MNDRFKSTTPVLRSADYLRARGFYCEQLGFEVAEEEGDPHPSQGGWEAYIHVHDARSL